MSRCAPSALANFTVGSDRVRTNLVSGELNNPSNVARASSSDGKLASLEISDGSKRFPSKEISLTASFLLSFAKLRTTKRKTYFREMKKIFSACLD